MHPFDALPFKFDLILFAGFPAKMLEIGHYFYDKYLTLVRLLIVVFSTQDSVRSLVTQTRKLFLIWLND